MAGHGGGPASPSDRCLEHEAKRELQVPGGTWQCLRDSAEVTRAFLVANAVDGILRGVGQVEGFGAELHLEPLCKREIFEQRQIHVLDSRATVGLVAEIAQRVRHRPGHSRDVKPLIRRSAARRGLIRMLARDRIGPRAEEGTDSVARSKSERLTR